MNTFARVRPAAPRPLWPGPSRLLSALARAALLLLALVAAACGIAAGDSDQDPRQEDESVASAPLPVTLPGAVDFGGAWGWVNGVEQVNPATGAASCPPGYTKTTVLGTYNVDWSLNICTRPHQAGVDPALDFGGMFNATWASLQPSLIMLPQNPRNNPLVDAMSCPQGYNARLLLFTSPGPGPFGKAGPNTAGIDSPLYMCWRNHVPGTEAEYSYGGMYGFVGSAPVNNPATNAQTCPAGFTAAVTYGIYNIDYPVTFCYGISAPLDFGGAWGHVGGVATWNPVTSAPSCPAGYADTSVLGTYNVDYAVHSCWRPSVPGRDPALDFGGMYGYVNAAPANNPISGNMGCPAGFTSQAILGTYNVDYGLWYCYRSHQANPPWSFGGMYGYVNGAPANNPATGALTCPATYAGSTVLGTYNVDYPLSFCWK